jgi:hypothetical protein
MTSRLVWNVLTVAIIAVVLLANQSQGGQSDAPDWRGRFTDPVLSSQPPRLTVLAGPLLTVPMGDFYMGYTPAAGVGLGVRYVADQHLAIRGVIRRSNLAKEQVNFIPSPDNAQNLFPEFGTDADIWRFSVAAEFFAGLNSGPSRHPSVVFLYLGAGLAYSNLTYNAVTFHDGVDPTMTIGAGLLAMVASRIGIEFGSSFDLVFPGGNNDDQLAATFRSQGPAGLFDLSASVVYGLSRD